MDSSKFLLLFLSVFPSSFASADWVNAYIARPTSGEVVVGSSLTVAASANGGAPITGWMIYMDSDPTPYYRLNSTVPSLNITLDISRLSLGQHKVIIKAWDAHGTEGDAWIWFDHVAASPVGTGFLGSINIPNPPTSAIHSTDIDNYNNWSSATGAVSQCPDGVASPTCNPVSANYNLTVQHSADPTNLSGSDNSTGTFQLFNSPAWATVIWGHEVLQNINVHKFIWDMWLYVDSTNYYSSEIDFYQSGYNGQRLMIGSQCNRAQDTWDTWNEATQHWIHSGIPCNTALSAGKWHRITYYMGTNPTANTYTYYAIRVDGADHVLNQTYNGKFAGWPQGLVGVQIQLDANASGAGVNEYIERMQLYSW
jgi:hypothetical protein